MNHERFDAWLDAGRPESLARDAEAHAATCARCRAALDAMRAIERSFASAPAPVAPAGLADGVMRRVASTRRAAQAPAIGTPAAPALAWWVRAAADPATIAACVLGALALWKGAVAAQLVVAFASSALAPAASAAPAAGPWASPEIAAGLTLALLPGVAWLSWWLYRWALRLAEPRLAAGGRALKSSVAPARRGAAAHL